MKLRQNDQEEIEYYALYTKSLVEQTVLLFKVMNLEVCDHPEMFASILQTLISVKQADTKALFSETIPTKMDDIDVGLYSIKLSLDSINDALKG